MRSVDKMCVCVFFLNLKAGGTQNNPMCSGGLKSVDHNLRQILIEYYKYFVRMSESNVSFYFCGRQVHMQKFSL
jgi:hypothetical protein